MTDDTGGVLPGATVETTGPALAGAPRVEVTDTDGRYAFTGLPAGTYTVRFTFPGFLSTSRDGVGLAVGATATIDAILQIGSLFEEVTRERRRLSSSSDADAAPSNDWIEWLGLLTLKFNKSFIANMLRRQQKSVPLVAPTL